MEKHESQGKPKLLDLCEKASDPSVITIQTHPEFFKSEVVRTSRQIYLITITFFMTTNKTLIQGNSTPEWVWREFEMLDGIVERSYEAIKRKNLDNAMMGRSLLSHLTAKTDLVYFVFEKII